jgi:hypothetical protein
VFRVNQPEKPMRTALPRAALLWSMCTIALTAATATLADVPERRPAQTVHPYPESFPLGDDRPHFGAVVAVRNDTALVGAPTHMFGGGVWSYVRTPWFWRRDSELPCPEHACDLVHSITLRDGFAVVGASDAVLIFRKELGAWRLKQHILPPEPDLLQFGHGQSVRYHDRVVTATAFPQGNEPGAVYVFELSTAGKVVRRQRLSARGATGGDGFGASVAISGQGIIVGAPDAAPNGATYVFRRIDGQWLQKQTLRPGNATSPGGFGLAVAIDQGVLLIGAPNAERSGGPNAGFAAGGTVYEFAVSNGVWLPRGKFRPSQSEYGSYTDFGRDIVMFGGRAMIAARPVPFVLPGRSIAFEYLLAAEGNQLVSFTQRESQGGMALFNNMFALGAPNSPEAGIGHVGVYDLKAPLQTQPFCAGVVQGPNAFCDDFENGTAERWQPVDGTWRVVDREYVGRAGVDRCSTGFSSNESLIRHLDAADVDVRVQMRSIQRVDKGVILRSTSPGNQIELNFLADPYNALAIQEVVNCELRIYQILSGIGIAGIHHELGEIVNIRIRLAGQRLQVWMKGQLVLDGSFPFRATRGSVGLSVITDLGYSVFDNVRVNVLR